MELSQPSQINSFIACGFNFGDLVTYEIAAGTSAGFGPPATGDIRVTCGRKLLVKLYCLHET